MALNLKSLKVERLAQEVANLTGSIKTEAIRQALLEKKQRLEATRGRDLKLSAIRFLEDRVWPFLSPSANRSLTREEKDQILGYGPDEATL